MYGLELADLKYFKRTDRILSGIELAIYLLSRHADSMFSKTQHRLLSATETHKH